MSNAFPWEFLMDFHSTWTCERRIRQRIASYQPDVVVSVHPTMNHAPLISTRKISAKLGKKIPFFTVVTDLGSAHCTWFQRGVDKLYVASERLRRLAKRRGRTPDDKIVMSGLPIRHDFAEQADRLGDRMSASGKEYQKTMKAQLGLNSEKPMVLVMGGGEGVGSLEKIVEELHASFVRRGVNATICVVCGRNGKLSQSLAGKDWTSIDARERKRRLKFPRVPFLGGHKRSKRIQASLDRVTASELTKAKVSGNVEVVGLGFITNMADYMVAADVLVTKAGPGTIAEAAAVGLPIMLTSFLPGQEAGNVDYVLDNGFGDYCENPQLISEEVATWLQDPSLLEEMSRRAQDAGHPTAASEIVLDIGSTTHTWMALNGDA
jgi:1,2-diacylglycerol 3-beta-galactosyltransferase